MPFKSTICQARDKTLKTIKPIMNITSISKWILTGLALGLSCAANAASEQPRFALIVGNGAYTGIGELPNPAADASLIADTLDGLGFETTLAIDTSQAEMKQQIANFGRKLRSSSKDAIGFFYYAGHGVQAEGRNYLLPVEAVPTDKADLDLMGVEANWILRQMESAGNRTNIIVLDACRNNPFVTASRSLNRGLAQIDAPTGSFISYATAPGKVALDGDNVNSPFTTALANALPTPGMPIEQIFKRVRVEVIQATNGRQIPWDSSSLVEDFVMQPEVATQIALADTAMDQPTQRELTLWKSVSSSKDADRISLFLQAYPESTLAEEARVLLIDTLMATPNDAQSEGNEQANSRATTAPANSEELNTATAKSANSEKIVIAELPAQYSAPETQLQELQLINKAQSSGALKDYQAYLNQFPNGIFVDLARAEIDSSKDTTASVLAPPEPAAESITQEVTSTAISVTGTEVITINTPLAESTAAVGVTKSIGELAQGSPLYAPFEGLEKSYWENEQCSNCHEWSQANLCEQGTFYTGTTPEAIERIKHPYGGFFKTALRLWAAADCQ